MTNDFKILEGIPEGPEIEALLWEHLASMHLHSPPESIHALDLESLRAPDITFWSVWCGPQLAGVGALKQLDAVHGEIKSMRTASAYLRQGVAAALLEHILTVAQRRSSPSRSGVATTVSAWKPVPCKHFSRPVRSIPASASNSADPLTLMLRIHSASL